MTVTNGNGKTTGVYSLSHTDEKVAFNLVISREDFLKGYNWNFTRYLEQQFNGADYLSWSNAVRALKELFPNYHVEVARKETTYGADGSQNGVILYLQVRDLVSNQTTPQMSFPVMNNKNNAIAYPDARELTDSEQRAKVKAIATFTGIGLRLWTKESLDLNLQDKRSNKDHPLLKTLLRINQLIDKAEAQGIIVEEQPNFGMSLYVLNQMGIELSESLKKSTLESARGSETPARVYESWKKPTDCLNWAKKVLNLDDDAARALLEDTQADESGSKKIPFYNRVMELK